ncbi:H/ACA ribonucleoprotein complex non-core subunit NAF1-like [Rhopilema esculentum]|uniref:H/ACA ribonucleoprotein complex non-core subunit NAF1-like n=1 Tax=Rhopilema esculentum TaxID=499914 RepID=UPI0031DE0B1C
MLESTDNINSDICESTMPEYFDDPHLNEKSNLPQVQESVAVLAKNDIEKESDLDSTENNNDDDNEEEFCDMSDLAFITKIVLKNQSFEPSKNQRRVSPFSSDDECDNGNDVVSRASQLLGRRLVSYDSDTGESEESCDSESSSSSSSTTSSSESDDEDKPNLRKIIMDAENEEDEVNHATLPKTKDEILPQELPVEPDIQDELPKDARLEQIGEIQSFVELMVVIKGVIDGPALDVGTVCFKEDRKPFGKVFDIFGPVKCPFYTVRLSSEEKFASLGLAVGETVYFAPNYLTCTNYVFVEQLKKMKGSDASWQFDQEPPPECIDYSDDEQEAKAKSAARRKRKERKTRTEDGDNQADGEDINMEKSHANANGKVRGKFSDSGKESYRQTPVKNEFQVGNARSSNTGISSHGFHETATSFQNEPAISPVGIRGHFTRPPFPAGSFQRPGNQGGLPPVNGMPREAMPGLTNQGAGFPRTRFQGHIQGQAPFGTWSPRGWVPSGEFQRPPPAHPDIRPHSMRPCSTFQNGSIRQGFRFPPSMPPFDPNVPPPMFHHAMPPSSIAADSFPPRPPRNILPDPRFAPGFPPSGFFPNNPHSQWNTPK